ncbi:PREDICTED: probable protein phosphatase 2C 24 [Tarenaya hassleriana]|uniref:probable protein phosphatase 2C 24 n=1 Tax=Tarenaya hassleriana TaxID=28532 RepID=UPI00053C8D20|nr:PREDICTED: probable protein phosphatase 2C 24 [Tarenaya hassleriana]
MVWLPPSWQPNVTLNYLCNRVTVLMADICYGVVKDDESPSGCEPRPARWRRMGVQRLRMSPGVDLKAPEEDSKRKKQEKSEGSSSTAVFSQSSGEDTDESVQKEMATDVSDGSRKSPVPSPKYGVTSVCGRRRDMEDAVAIHHSFFPGYSKSRWHYFGVYDGHGCSHVAWRCRERLHKLVQEELLEYGKEEWNRTMKRSFARMDKEVVSWKKTVKGANCRCDLQAAECDAVGSTAVVSVITPEKIIVANCGDSRAVLCRKGKPIALSTDHKPDRPDELDRIQAAGGRVIYWDGPRVLGVLAMSRAIGDNYLKPYVSCEPEITITDRTDDDDCLILASDGLWDVVSNETACAVAHMCLSGKARGGRRRSTDEEEEEEEEKEKVGTRRKRKGRKGEISDQACTAASVLLTKLALTRNSNDNVSVVVIDLRKGTR